MKKYDLIVIGGGSAGFAAGLKASELGKKVAIIESGTVGGTCLNVGCVPTKSLLRAAELSSLPKRNRYKGISITNKNVDLSVLIDQKNSLLEELRHAKYINIYENDPNIDFVEGTGCFLNSKELMVDDVLYSAEKIVISTGSSAIIPSIEGLDKVAYLTNIEALELREIPKAMTIVGGGAVAVEFAQMFQRLGTKVTLLVRGDRLVKKEDKDISIALEIALENEGILILKQFEIENLDYINGKIVVNGNQNKTEMKVESDQILLATGRSPNTNNLNLKKAGVSVDTNGFIEVTPYLQTSNQNIFAVGDVIGGQMLVTVDAHEGSIAAANAFSITKTKIDYSAVPHAIFTDPQVAAVGLTAENAIQQGFDIRTSVLPMELVPKAKAIYQPDGFIKMIIDKNTERVLGVHIISHLASEIIHEATLAVKYNMSISDLISTIHVYPTMSESIKLVAQSFKKDTSKLSCCAE